MYSNLKQTYKRKVGPMHENILVKYIYIIQFLGFFTGHLDSWIFLRFFNLQCYYLTTYM